MSQHFGEHLTIDGYGGDRELLNDKNLVLKILNELPKIFEMHLLADPLVVLAPDNGHKDPGSWSGFVIIAESHISIHTFPRRKFLSADIYSCKNEIDTKYIEKYFKEKFKPQDLETNFIKRGTRYPSENI